MRWYVDSSALIKLFVEEQESAVLDEHLDRHQPELVACHLLETEARRAASRLGAPQSSVTQALAEVNLYDVDQTLFRQAGHLPGASLRSLDAIHLVAALSLDVDAVLTYDTRLAESAELIGLPTVSPGR
ncbi:MAG: type II toxin-antitoxin system VapC family toxin [Micrococcales bacterium]|nr:type II toxin-antitoxin system VapC family toxin [Micrococcales bacterium]